jgi:hypothetical protein
MSSSGQGGSSGRTLRSASAAPSGPIYLDQQLLEQVRSLLPAGVAHDMEAGSHDEAAIEAFFRATGAPPVFYTNPNHPRAQEYISRIEDCSRELAAEARAALAGGPAARQAFAQNAATAAVKLAELAGVPAAVSFSSAGMGGAAGLSGPGGAAGAGAGAGAGAAAGSAAAKAKAEAQADTKARIMQAQASEIAMLELGAKGFMTARLRDASTTCCFCGKNACCRVLCLTCHSTGAPYCMGCDEKSHACATHQRYALLDDANGSLQQFLCPLTPGQFVLGMDNPDLVTYRSVRECVRPMGYAPSEPCSCGCLAFLTRAWDNKHFTTVYSIFGSYFAGRVLEAECKACGAVRKVSESMLQQCARSPTVVSANASASRTAFERPLLDALLAVRQSTFNAVSLERLVAVCGVLCNGRGPPVAATRELLRLLEGYRALVVPALEGLSGSSSCLLCIPGQRRIGCDGLHGAVLYQPPSTSSAYEFAVPGSSNRSPSTKAVQAALALSPPAASVPSRTPGSCQFKAARPGEALSSSGESGIASHGEFISVCNHLVMLGSMRMPRMESIMYHILAFVLAMPDVKIMASDIACFVIKYIDAACNGSSSKQGDPQWLERIVHRLHPTEARRSVRVSFGEAEPGGSRPLLITLYGVRSEGSPFPEGISVLGNVPSVQLRFSWVVPVLHSAAHTQCNPWADAYCCSGAGWVSESCEQLNALVKRAALLLRNSSMSACSLGWEILASYACQRSMAVSAQSVVSRLVSAIERVDRLTCEVRAAMASVPGCPPWDGLAAFCVPEQQLGSSSAAAAAAALSSSSTAATSQLRLLAAQASVSAVQRLLEQCGVAAGAPATVLQEATLQFLLSSSRDLERAFKGLHNVTVAVAVQRLAALQKEVSKLEEKEGKGSAGSGTLFNVMGMLLSRLSALYTLVHDCEAAKAELSARIRQGEPKNGGMVSQLRRKRKKLAPRISELLSVVQSILKASEHSGVQFPAAGSQLCTASFAALPAPLCTVFAPSVSAKARLTALWRQLQCAEQELQHVRAEPQAAVDSRSALVVELDERWERLSQQQHGLAALSGSSQLFEVTAGPEQRQVLYSLGLPESHSAESSRSLTDGMAYHMVRGNAKYRDLLEHFERLAAGVDALFGAQQPMQLRKDAVGRSALSMQLRRMLHGSLDPRKWAEDGLQGGLGSSASTSMEMEGSAAEEGEEGGGEHEAVDAEGAEEAEEEAEAEAEAEEKEEEEEEEEEEREDELDLFSSSDGPGVDMEE